MWKWRQVKTNSKVSVLYALYRSYIILYPSHVVYYTFSCLTFYPALFARHCHHSFSAYAFPHLPAEEIEMFSRPTSTSTSRFGGARTINGSSTTTGAYTTASMRAKPSLTAATASSAARRTVTDENRVPSYARPTLSTAAAAAANHVDVEMKDVSVPYGGAAGRARPSQVGAANGRSSYSRPILREHTTNVPAARPSTTGTLHVIWFHMAVIHAQSSICAYDWDDV